MEKKYAIILFKGKEYLCGHEDGCHYDVSCPVRTFTEGEDDFKIQESGKNRSERTFRYHGKEFRLVTGFYPNGWPVLSLESPDNGELYTVLTVNLEDSPAFGIPDQAFIDINNNPEAMEFLIRNISLMRVILSVWMQVLSIKDITRMQPGLMASARSTMMQKN